MPPDPTPIRLAAADNEYYVEISGDDDQHYIRIGCFAHFDQACAEYRRLIQDDPDMRVTMRRRAHVYRHFIPRRLRADGDRRR